MRGTRLWLTMTALCVAIGCLASCDSKRPLLYDVEIAPATISPNADGIADVARIKYSVARRAMVSVYLVDALGGRHVLREQAARPPGTYEALFSGVVADRLLPDGSYLCVFEAVGDGADVARKELPLTLEGGEPTHIEILNLTIHPPILTPNRDGISDRVTIGYYLTKEATKVQVYLLGADGKRYPLPEDKIRPVGQQGNHEHDYEGEVDRGATPPPDGDYEVVVEAEDAVGNRQVVRGTLTIKNGGVPQVEIVNRAATWSSGVVPLGEVLSFTCTVRNIGNVGVRTKGPPPGTLYNTSENFNSKEMYEEPGVFRVGLDYDGNSSGRQYPFRWQLGRDDELTDIDGYLYLMPGQAVEVVGHLRIVDVPVTIAPYHWIGLIHEQVQIVMDRVEASPISVGF